MTWHEFCDVFKKHYQPVAASETARTLLHQMKQQGPVSTYIDQFLKYLNAIDQMATEDQIYLFKRGLNFSLAKEVSMHHPTSIHEAMQLAQRAEVESKLLRSTNGDGANSNYNRNGRNGWGNNNRNNNNNNNSNRNQKPWMTHSTHSNSTTTPMELGQVEEEQSSEENNSNGFEPPARLNAMNGNNNYNNSMNRNTNRIRVPGLSREEVQYCMTNGLCMWCKKPGHMVRNCPRRDNRNDSKNGTGSQ
jgi:hypothetical protein